VNLKVALLLLLAFAFLVTPAAMVLNISTAVSLPALLNALVNSNSLIEPLGDPIDGPGVPH